MQFVSDCLISHLCTLSSLLLLLHSAFERDYFVSFEMCHEMMIRSVLCSALLCSALLCSAPTIWALRDRFYDLLRVALWVQEITISAFASPLNDSFLVKRKPFLSQLLLPVTRLAKKRGGCRISTMRLAWLLGYTCSSHRNPPKPLLHATQPSRTHGQNPSRTMYRII